MNILRENKGRLTKEKTFGVKETKGLEIRSPKRWDNTREPAQSRGADKKS